jgi:hypothetical protein
MARSPIAPAQILSRGNCALSKMMVRALSFGSAAHKNKAVAAPVGPPPMIAMS